MGFQLSVISLTPAQALTAIVPAIVSTLTPENIKPTIRRRDMSMLRIDVNDGKFRKLELLEFHSLPTKYTGGIDG